MVHIQILERSGLFSYYMYSSGIPHMCRTQIGINIAVGNRNLVLFSLMILHVCNVPGAAFICIDVTVGNFCEAEFCKAILEYCFLLL